MSQEAAKFELLQSYSGHSKSVSSVRLSNSGQLVSGSADKSCRIWDLSGHKQVNCFEGHSQGINEVCWHPGGRLVCSSSDDFTTKLWDTRTNSCVITLQQHTSYVMCCACHPRNERVLISGSFDETVIVWDIRYSRSLRVLPAHQDPITSVSLCEDGSALATSSLDGLCRVWCMDTGKCLFTINSPENPAVARVLWSANSQYLVTSSLDGIIRLWDNFLFGQTPRILKEYSGHVCQKYCIDCCIVQSRYIVSGSEDCNIIMWPVNFNKQVIKFDQSEHSRHIDTVISVHSCGALLASGSMDKDKTIRVWKDVNHQE